MTDPSSSQSSFQLIVTITPQGRATAIMNAAKDAGAEGGTIVRGRGSGIHEGATFLGIPIEPEKDLLLVLIPKNRTERVLEAIVLTGKLDEPGNGIAFVLDVPRVEGIVHRGKIRTSVGETTP